LASAGILAISPSSLAPLFKAHPRNASLLSQFVVGARVPRLESFSWCLARGVKTWVVSLLLFSEYSFAFRGFALFLPACPHNIPSLDEVNDPLDPCYMSASRFQSNQGDFTLLFSIRGCSSTEFFTCLSFLFLATRDVVRPIASSVIFSALTAHFF